jgi:hypothetical protein
MLGLSLSCLVMIVCVYAHVWYMQVSVKCLLNQFDYT